jgi:hypothetical protein
MPRLLIMISGGMVETVAVEGLPEGVELELVKLDYDTDGDGPEENPDAYWVDGKVVYVTVETVGEMSADDAALARMARDAWRLT